MVGIAVPFFSKNMYSAVRGFWPVKELVELAGGSTACCEMARGRCLFAWNFSVARSTVLTCTAAERRSTRIMTLSLH